MSQTNKTGPTPPKSALALIPRDVEYEYPPITHFLPKSLWEDINFLRSESPRPILGRESPVMFTDQQSSMDAMIFQEFLSSQNRATKSIQNNMNNNESEMQRSNTQLSTRSSPIYIYSSYSPQPFPCIKAEPIFKNDSLLGFHVPNIHDSILNNINGMDIEIQLFDKKLGGKFPVMYVEIDETFVRPMSAFTQHRSPSNTVNPTMVPSLLRMSPNSNFNENFNFNRMNNYPLLNTENVTMSPSSTQVTPNSDFYENRNFRQINNSGFRQNHNIPLNYSPQSIESVTVGPSSMQVSPNFENLQIPENRIHINNIPFNYPAQNIVNPSMGPSLLQMTPNTNFNANLKQLYITENPNLRQMNNAAFTQNDTIVNNIPLRYPMQNIVNQQPHVIVNPNLNQMNNTTLRQNHTIVNNRPMRYPVQNIVNSTLGTSLLLKPQIIENPNLNRINNTVFTQNHNIINNNPMRYPPEYMVNPTMSHSLQMAPRCNFITNFEKHTSRHPNMAFIQNNIPLNYPSQHMVNPPTEFISLQMAPQANFNANFEKQHIHLNNLMSDTNCRQGQSYGGPVGKTHEKPNIGAQKTNGITSKYLQDKNYEGAFQDIRTTENPTVDEITPTIYYINPHLHPRQQPPMQCYGYNLPIEHLNRLPGPHINENAAFIRTNSTLLHRNELFPNTISRPPQIIGNYSNGQRNFMLPYSTQQITINKNINETLRNAHPSVNPDLNQMIIAFNNISIWANPYYHLAANQPKTVPPPPGFSNPRLPQPSTFNHSNGELGSKNIPPPPEFHHLNGQIHAVHDRFGNRNHEFPNGNIPPRHAFGNQNGHIPTQYMPPYPGPNQNAMGPSVNQNHAPVNNLPITYMLVNPDVTKAYGFCHVLPKEGHNTSHPEMNNINGNGENFNSMTESPMMNHMGLNTNCVVPNTPIASQTNMQYQNCMLTDNQNAQMYGLSRMPQMHQNMKPTTQFQGSPRPHQMS